MGRSNDETSGHDDPKSNDETSGHDEPRSIKAAIVQGFRELHSSSNNSDEAPFDQDQRNWND